MVLERTAMRGRGRRECANWTLGKKKLEKKKGLSRGGVFGEGTWWKTTNERGKRCFAEKRRGLEKKQKILQHRILKAGNGDLEYWWWGSRGGLTQPEKG